MRKCHAISLLVLSAAMLTAGCSRSRTFYDAQGQMVPRTQWRDGRQLFNAQGQPVPAEEVNAAYNSSSSSYRRSSSWGRSSIFSGFGGTSHSTSSS